MACLQDISSYRNRNLPTLWRTINWLKTWLCFTVGLINLHLYHSPSQSKISDITKPNAPPAITYLLSTHLPPAVKLCEEDVLALQRQKIRKALGPKAVAPSCLKVCADQLAPNLHSDLQQISVIVWNPPCIKLSTIIKDPKKPSIRGLNDYWPVALTSVVMKSSERLVLTHLKDITNPPLDILPFAYWANRQVRKCMYIHAFPEICTPFSHNINTSDWF